MVALAGGSHCKTIAVRVRDKACGRRAFPVKLLRLAMKGCELATMISTVRVDGHDGNLRGAIAALLAATGFSLLTPQHVRAQDYPSKSIRLVVPFPPGGGTDILARTYGQNLTESLGQTVVVENRPGAGGNLGTEYAVRSAPDGYTLLMISASFAVNPSLYKLAFDPLKDLAAISHVASVPLVLVAYPGVAAANVRELVALAQAKPAELTYASSGNGSAPHLAGELFTMLTNTRMTHVPYKGGAPALTDVLGGQTQLLFSTLVQALPHLKSGKLKSLGMGSQRRSNILPDLATIDESGVPGYDMVDWFGVLAPARTPPPIVARLNREILHHAQRAELRSRLAADGVETIGSSASEFERLIRNDIEKFARIVRAARVTLQ
jgi:tripartite-type tricarboxylate transporter receptor subunit TctC